jgi:hypothetical protein
LRMSAAWAARTLSLRPHAMESKTGDRESIDISRDLGLVNPHTEI